MSQSSISKPSKIILGIHDGTHDAGACIIQDGQILAAMDEERFLRRKNAGGFPTNSIINCLEVLQMHPTDIDEVAFAGLINPNPVLRLFRNQQEKWRLDDGHFYNPSNTGRFSNWLQFQSPFPKIRSNNVWWNGLLTKRFQRELHQKIHFPKDTKISIFDHHQCHAAAGYYQSGFEEALVVVADGIGDGLCLSLWKGNGLSLSKIFEMPYPHSYGLLYASITGYFGFKPFRHEGKVTGLSAAGTASNIPIAFPFQGDFPNRKITESFPLYEWLQGLDGYSKEDTAAWLQHGIQRELGEIIKYFMKSETHRNNKNHELSTNLVCSGGLFANVSLNQYLVEYCQPRNIFIFPNMGDAGLSVGAAHLAYPTIPKPLETLFLGTDINQNHTVKTVQKANLKCLKGNIVELTAQALQEGKIVARCSGRMEYGPRALGNRSILASAKSPNITQRLNHALQRSDFMPFAPMIRREDMDLALKPSEPSNFAYQWMTITGTATEYLMQTSPAIVHIDKTLRPQIIDQKQKELWDILTLHKENTGEIALINTSFNIHEEPIVCNISEAITTFKAAKLDALILGDYWITHTK